MSTETTTPATNLKNTIQQKITTTGSTFFEVAKNFILTNKFTIGLIIAALVLILTSIFFFQDFFNKQFSKKPTNEPNEDDDGENTCEIIFFYTTWCPYCKKALPVWQEFSQQWNGEQLNGYTITTSEVDCDADEALANKFDVTGYPTIKCIMNGKVTDYQAKPSVETLNQFLHTCVG